MAGHLYLYTGVVVTGDRTFTVDGTAWRDGGGPLSEEEIVASSITSLRTNQNVTGHATPRDFIYTDVGLLTSGDSDDPEDGS